MKFIGLIIGLFLILGSAFSTDIPNNGKYIEKKKIEVSNDELKSNYINLKNELEDLKKECENIKSSINLIDEKVNQSISRESNFISFITWTSGIVIAFVGLLFGFFSVLMYVGNRKNIRESEKLLKDANNLKADFELWFKLRQEDYKKVIRNDYKKALAILQNSTKLEKLKELLKGKKIDQKEIYPLVTSLSFNPSYEYKPYFNKIIELNISEEISELARIGINKLAED